MSCGPDAVLEAGKKLLAEGLIVRTWGNVSCRRGAEMWITPSGRSYERLHPEDIVKMDLRTGTYGGSVKPSSEWRVHQGIYLARPDIAFIIHTHQMEASVYSTFGRDLPVADGIVPIAAYGFPGSETLEMAVEAVLGEADGVLMANHGILAFGKDGESAFSFAREMEEAAKKVIKQAEMEEGQRQFAAVLQDMAVVPEVTMPKTEFYSEAIKSARRDIAALFPVDTGYIQAFSRLGKKLCPYIDDFAQIVGVDMIGAPLETDAIVAALGDRQGVFLAGAGAVFGGTTLEDAKAAATIAEKNCRAFFKGLLFAGAKALGAEEALALRKFYLDIYSRRY